MSFRVSSKTLKELENNIEGHQIKILALIYKRYIEKTGVAYDDFIKEFSNK